MNAEELAELDLAVAKAEGFSAARLGGCDGDVCWTGERIFSPTRDRAEAMRLLCERLDGLYRDGDVWFAYKLEVDGGRVARFNKDPFVAICRAVVALKSA